MMTDAELMAAGGLLYLNAGTERLNGSPIASNVREELEWRHAARTEQPLINEVLDCKHEVFRTLEGCGTTSYCARCAKKWEINPETIEELQRAINGATAGLALPFAPGGRGHGKVCLTCKGAGYVDTHPGGHNFDLKGRCMNPGCCHRTSADPEPCPVKPAPPYDLTCGHTQVTEGCSSCEWWVDIGQHGGR